MSSWVAGYFTKCAHVMALEAVHKLKTFKYEFICRYKYDDKYDGPWGSAWTENRDTVHMLFSLILYDIWSDIQWYSMWFNMMALEAVHKLKTETLYNWRILVNSIWYLRWKCWLKNGPHIIADFYDFGIWVDTTD